jgi:hypothetical protein
LLDNEIEFEEINRAAITSIRKGLYESGIEDNSLDETIMAVYRELSININYDILKRNLQRIAQTGDSYWEGWNGVYRDNIRDHIQHRFVRDPSIQTLDALLQKIEQDLTPVVRGYTVISWFNQWTSTIIERFFMENPHVTPTVRRIDKVDFFFLDIPFDLKITFLPEQYAREKRRELGTRSDLDVINSVIDEPLDLAKWLYENQGEPRFSDNNRIFIVLIDEDDLSRSWKLKAEFDLINEKVHRYLDNQTAVPEVRWDFDGDRIRGHFATYGDVLLITRRNPR